MHAHRATFFFQDEIKLDLGQGRKACFRYERKRVNKCDSSKCDRAEGFSTTVTKEWKEGMLCPAVLGVTVQLCSLKTTNRPRESERKKHHKNQTVHGDGTCTLGI